MTTVSQGHVIEETVKFIDDYYTNNPSNKATTWQNDNSQPDSLKLRHDRILKLYDRRAKSIKKDLEDGDISFPSANYFLKANQYQIPAIIAQGISQLLAFEYMKPDRDTYPIFMTFCVDNLSALYARTTQSVNQINFLRINLEILIGACTNRHLLLEPQDFMSATEATTYNKLLDQYPLQRNRFLVRLSAYYYMNLLFPIKTIRAFKDKYNQIINILKSNFYKDYNAFIASKAMSISASDCINTKTDIALNEDAYLHTAANQEPQDYLIQILDSLALE
ncbi:hypothetical protein [Lactiplantibacillus mudanjiangensis]|uniref:Uncharacterized protein n=1 Tax=Lactiplantibacillus mudanjiangensis TaxID=1296538 RepID=A0A660DU89_9LACO|nr:hypothetical protein [Lactiplantibacillus mudanjiangensis]VDG22699.1 hypothetical protein [Lactobacillus plantarum 16] [Lactiplantibacillus mudanjiangensis]VDG26763.1 hypothetical protein [Lactobacillus plantarum 16] [Lactiplantibacillus mudanjiangensis]